MPGCPLYIEKEDPFKKYKNLLDIRYIFPVPKLSLTTASLPRDNILVECN